MARTLSLSCGGEQRYNAVVRNVVIGFLLAMSACLLGAWLALSTTEDIRDDIANRVFDQMIEQQPAGEGAPTIIHRPWRGGDI